MINLYNCDCMDFMADKPDNAYDLAIVDPPYSIKRFKSGSIIFAKEDRYKNGIKWDNQPNDRYFKELKRISKHRIIWGANYMNRFETGGAIVWFKDVKVNNFSKCEIASNSNNQIVDYFRFDWTNTDRYNMSIKKIHPTQKPAELYKFCLKNYAKKGDKILDTHGGSMSIAIACHDMGFDLDLCELDKDYFEAGKKRYENHISQMRMF